MVQGDNDSDSDDSITDMLNEPHIQGFGLVVKKIQQAKGKARHRLHQLKSIEPVVPPPEAQSGDKNEHCHACGGRHMTARCWKAGFAAWIRTFLYKPEHQEVIAQMQKNWMERFLLHMKDCENDTPLDVLTKYCDQYHFSPTKVAEEMDWDFFHQCNATYGNTEE